MNYMQMLDELRGERELVDHAIVVLERIYAGAPRGRGRPPGWLSERRKEVGAGAGNGSPMTGEAGVTQIKRKRGRPRKNPL